MISETIELLNDEPSLKIHLNHPDKRESVLLKLTFISYPEEIADDGGFSTGGK